MGIYLISGDVLAITRKDVRLQVTVVEDAEGIYGSVDYDDEVCLPLRAFPLSERQKLADCIDSRQGFEGIFCRTSFFDECF